MKNLKLSLTIVILVFLANGLFAQAKIQFKEINHDFGKIKEEPNAAIFNFEFTNTGNVPLILSKVEPSCNCTAPEWPHNPIAPGAKGVIKVSYNPVNRPGAFNKTIAINSNASVPTVTLAISGEVIPKAQTIDKIFPIAIGNVRLKSSTITFPKMKKADSKEVYVEITNTSKQKVTISFTGLPAFLQVTDLPLSLAPNEKSMLTFKLDGTKVAQKGALNSKATLTTSEGKSLGLTISGNLE